MNEWKNNECGMLVERYWHEKTDVLREKTVQVPLCPLPIQSGPSDSYTRNKIFSSWGKFTSWPSLVTSLHHLSSKSASSFLVSSHKKNYWQNWREFFTSLKVFRATYQWKYPTWKTYSKNCPSITQQSSVWGHILWNSHWEVQVKLILGNVSIDINWRR